CASRSRRRRRPPRRVRSTGEAALAEARLEERHAVMSPERLAAEQKERHAEDVIRLGLGHTARILGDALAEPKALVRGGRCPTLREQPPDRRRLVELELAAEEATVRLLRITTEASGAHGVQPADQRRLGIVDLERPLDDEPTRRRPAPRVEVG